MGEPTTYMPFGDDEIPEIRLSRDPLLRVLAQLRFPPLVVLNKSSIESTLVPVLHDLAGDYPISQEGHEVQVEIGPEGIKQTPGGSLITVENAKKTWKVTIGTSFLSIETSRYESREDFVARLGVVLKALLTHVPIPYFERIGFRYTNRIEESTYLLSIEKLVQPALLGGYAPSTSGSVKMQHSLSETVYDLGDRMLGARWGFLPPGGSIDPSLPVAKGASWIFDLDAYSQVVFDPEPISSVQDRVSEMAVTAYRYFRWGVTDDFIQTFRDEIS